MRHLLCASKHCAVLDIPANDDDDHFQRGAHRSHSYGTPRACLQDRQIDHLDYLPAHKSDIGNRVSSMAVSLGCFLIILYRGLHVLVVAELWDSLCTTTVLNDGCRDGIVAGQRDTEPVDESLSS